MTGRAAVPLVAVAAMVVACTSDPVAEPEPTPVPSPPSSPVPTPEPTPEPTEHVPDPLAAFYAQSLAWVPCDDEFECATLDVPLDYDDPGRATVTLAVLRALATSDDRIGSLVVNPGGPGGSGVAAARDPDVVSRDVRSRYDIVGFDPRGVGESAPIDCLDDAELDELIAGEGTPGDDTAEALAERYRALAAGCEARSGELLPYIGTVDVARDMDVLRAALGDEVLYYLGRSYGTLLGAHYADLFPERVGRVVLDGAVDPSLSGQEYALGQARGVEIALSAYLGWCVERDRCPLGPSEGEARATLAGLLEAIAEQPLATEDDARPLTLALAVYGLIRPLYFSTEERYGELTDALRDALADNGSALLRLADEYLGRSEDGTYDTNQLEVFYAVHCVDRPDATDPESIETALEEFEEASSVVGSFLGWSGLVCGEWPVAPTGTPSPVRAVGAAPILVVGTTGDLATPYEWAVALADQLAPGALVTYDGVGHLAYRRAGSDCVDDAVDAYLLDGELPEEELVCS